MPIEVEMKFRLDDRQLLELRLQELGATRHGTSHQADHYFAHPSRDLAAADEALRIREENGRGVLCWKGPRAPGPVKIREEIEAPFAGGSVVPLRQVLERLGFRPVATVEKHRESWSLPAALKTVGGPAIPPADPIGTDRGRADATGTDAVTIALDSVVGLGEFAEVELVAAADDRAAAARRVEELARRLGLDTPERRSYLTLLLETTSRTA